MIKEVTMYTIVCDRCGEDAGEDAEFSAWDDAGFAEDNAISDGWEEHEEKEEKG